MSRSKSILIIIGMLILSLLFLSLSGILRFSSLEVSANRFPHVKSLWLNRQANQQLKAQNYLSAFDTYVKTLEFEPFSPEVHLDLGLSYEGQQLKDKAMLSYQNSLKYAQEDEMKFMSLFNQAQLLGKDKKVDEALDLYQRALAYQPSSKEIKTNIELLIQQQQQQQQQQNSENSQDQKDSQDKKDQDPKNQKDNKDSKGNQDQKDKKDPKENSDKDKKDDKGQDDKDKKDKQEKPQYGQSPKYKPRPFKGEELSEGDVKKILGEIKQQEQKIRSEYNRKEVKEQPRDKDW